MTAEAHGSTRLCDRWSTVDQARVWEKPEVIGVDRSSPLHEPRLPEPWGHGTDGPHGRRNVGATILRLRLTEPLDALPGQCVLVRVHTDSPLGIAERGFPATYRCRGLRCVLQLAELALCKSAVANRKGRLPRMRTPCALRHTVQEQLSRPPNPGHRNRRARGAARARLDASRAQNQTGRHPRSAGPVRISHLDRARWRTAWTRRRGNGRLTTGVDHPLRRRARRGGPDDPAVLQQGPKRRAPRQRAWSMAPSGPGDGDDDHVSRLHHLNTAARAFT